MRKDQARRLRYQEEQRVRQKCDGFVDTKNAYGYIKLPKGQVKTFLTKLVK